MAGSSNGDFNIHDVTVKQVPLFTVGGKSQVVTRVTMYIGPHGPFTKDFGPGQDQPDTPAAVNAWKQQTLTNVQSMAS